MGNMSGGTAKGIAGGISGYPPRGRGGDAPGRLGNGSPCCITGGTAGDTAGGANCEAHSATVLGGGPSRALGAGGTAGSRACGMPEGIAGGANVLLLAAISI